MNLEALVANIGGRHSLWLRHARFRRHPRFRRHVIALTTIALLATSLNTQIAQSADSPPRKILSGWIPYYSMDTALPSAVANGDLIKEVMPFWYTLKSESKITDLYTPANPSVPISTPLTAMRDSGFKIIPTITDGTAKSILAGLLAKPSSRAQIVASITALVLNNNYDGIDLDFEGFAFVDGTASWNATRPNWVIFIQELSVSLHALDKVLSVTTPVLFDPASGKRGYYVFDWASISPFIDRLRIMTYDYSTANPGPIGPLTWIERSLQYAISVVPASKIYIGVAGYGRDWVTKVVGICPSQYSNSVVAGAKAATFVMSKAAGLAASYFAMPVYNQAFGEVNFTYEKTYLGQTSSGLATVCTATRTAWYQDARSYGARAQLVAKYHLGGIAAWTFGMEDPAAIEAVRQVAQSIAPDLILATLTADQSNVTFGMQITLTATAQLNDAQPVAGLALRLEAKSAGEELWREIGQLTSGADGTISTALIVGKSTTLRLSSDATWERSASQSVELAITSSRLISVAAPTINSRGIPFTISGILQPHQSGISLILEKYVAGKWLALNDQVKTGEMGDYAISTMESSSGINRYRISAAEDSLFQASVSPIFAILVL